MKISILFLCLCLLPLGAFGQRQIQYAKVTYGKNHQIVLLQRMLNDTIFADCCRSRFSGSGVITEVEYRQEEILSFTLRLPNGRRKNVAISSTQFVNADRGWLYTLIKEKNRVKVDGCLCGNGGYWHADEIALIKQ